MDARIFIASLLDLAQTLSEVYEMKEKSSQLFSKISTSLPRIASLEYKRMRRVHLWRNGTYLTVLFNFTLSVPDDAQLRYFPSCLQAKPSREIDVRWESPSSVPYGMDFTSCIFLNLVLLVNSEGWGLT